MSYCRWSSDDFRCDLYCYEDVSGGWTTHVAASRTVDDPPVAGEITGSMSDAEMATWLAAHKAQMAWLETAARRPVGGAHDGASFSDPTIEAFRARLTDLRVSGYRFPDYVIEAVDAEIAEGAKA